MKKSILTIPLASLMFFGINFISCDNEAFNEVNPQQKNTVNLASKLTAPNGMKISSDEVNFKAEMQNILEQIYGTDASKCIITDIKFFEVPQGYAASIEYLSPNNEPGNYILSNTLFSYTGKNLKVDAASLKTFTESKSSFTIPSFSILSKPTDTKNISRIKGEWDKEKNTMVYSPETEESEAILKYNIH